MADFTGLEEQAFILDDTTGVGAYCGGRVWESQVPDEVTIDTLDDGSVAPYITLHFQTPFASSNGRSIGGHEGDQPYIMAFSAVAHAADPDTAKRVIAGVQTKLTGLRPSSTAGEIRSRGGWPGADKATGSRPTRFLRGAWFEVVLNL